MQVRFHDDARRELIAEIAYYEATQPGLGQRFRVRVAEAVRIAATFPDAGSTFKYGTRRVIPKSFPF